MCGIVGYVGSRNCTDVLINGLTKLEYRGYDSAGIAVFSESGNIQVAKSKGRLADLIHKMEQEGRPEGHAGIGHTRWATHGEPSDINSHPHTGGRVTIVHNGIIENYKELKEYLSATAARLKPSPTPFGTWKVLMLWALSSPTIRMWSMRPEKKAR